MKSTIIFALTLLLLPPLYAQTEVSAEKTATELIRLLQENYYRPVTTGEILECFVSGAQKTLGDSYFKYYTPIEYKSFLQEINADKLQGIAAIIKKENDGSLQIIRPLEGGPADKAGVKAGDKIVAINGERELKRHSLAVLVQKLRGAKGSKVTLNIVRAATREEMVINVIREEFSYNTFQYSMLQNGVGYCKVQFFNKGIAEALQGMLKKFEQEKALGLVLDLRHCPGGRLDEVIATADLFLEQCTVLRETGRMDKIVEKKSENPAAYNGKLVVLINKKSSSGAEVLAGAFQDHNRAIIVGEKSFGKGSIQKVFDLSNGGAVKFTITYYQTPSGRTVEKNGIVPDVEIYDEKKQLKVAAAMVRAMSKQK